MAAQTHLAFLPPGVAFLSVSETQTLVGHGAGLEASFYDHGEGVKDKYRFTLQLTLMKLDV